MKNALCSFVLSAMPAIIVLSALNSLADKQQCLIFRVCPFSARPRLKHFVNMNRPQ